MSTRYVPSLEDFEDFLFSTVHIILLLTGARLLSEKQIKDPIKSVLDHTLTVFFKFSNIGYVRITCVHLIVTTDTNEVKYRIFGGGISRDFINFSVVGKNANVMMSRAIVYGI